MNLKKLAQLLNLSPTTVSRALNGFPEVSEATRNRVQEAAKKHHYHPNAKAKGLATGRTNAIGHVIPVSAGHEMVNPIFADFISGASKAYLESRYDMLLSLVEDSEEHSAYQKITARGRVDGLIVHGPKVEDGRVELLKGLGLPFVVHGRMSKSEGYSWVDVNNESAFARGTAFLSDLGHKRIALINGLETMVFAKHRLQGYCKTLQERSSKLNPEWMAAGEMTEPFGYISAAKMLDSGHAPTAFMVSSIIMAIGVRRAIEERGLKLGHDVSLITFDDNLSYLKGEEEVPVFTSLRSSVREAGRRCAENLIFLINHPDNDPIQELSEVSLIVGRSTAPPRR